MAKFEIIEPQPKGPDKTRKAEARLLRVSLIDATGAFHIFQQPNGTIELYSVVSGKFDIALEKV